MSTAAESYSPDLSHELRRIESWDTGLVMATVMLLGIGSVMVYSATINPDTLNHSNGELTLRKHLIHVGIGIGAMVGAMAIPYRAWKRLVYPALLLVTFLLLLVTFFGTTAGNARRWLSFPGFNVQPAEMAKLAFVIFLVAWTERIRRLNTLNCAPMN